MAIGLTLKIGKRIITITLKTIFAAWLNFMKEREISVLP